ncbi:ankyrin repeat-rich membrane spanning protein [Fistulifera solaris]|uniref:Ankyrin repeat-rich membrane spanning protein n=1 Tax=Fistulifera solaris TaxID=1519565 RepID=A0A1Z5JM01_FISSO|nr:ankyrin repeat-rich membrane spanning protein [Fistulifera solaris]|eukprot:GAX14882.1 ankyrin repeat-rich membrane spanning protein [Fistulifera solaris]
MERIQVGCPCATSLCSSFCAPHTTRKTPIETLLSIILRRPEPVDHDSIYSVFAPEDVATLQLLSDPLDDWSAVADLLRRGANLHVCDNTNSTPLLRATRNGHYRVVELLLQSGADAAHQDFAGLTALDWATHYGDASLIRLLLPYFVNSAVLLIAVERNMPDVVRLFCTDSRVDVNYKNEEGSAALHNACNTGFEQVVDVLLQHSEIQVDVMDASGGTPLLQACQHDHRSIAMALLEAGANVNHADQSGDTPLLIATKCGYVKLVKILLRCGANVNVRDSYGTTVLLAACNLASSSILQLILPKVGNVEETDSCHLSPLFLATDRGNREMVRLLLHAGASIHESDDDFTPFLLAIVQGRTEIVSEMLQHGTYADDDPTPLQTALSAGQLDVVYLLLRGDPLAQLQTIVSRAA